MPRWLSVVFVVLALLVAGVALVWYFAYGLADAPPRRASIEGLTAPVTLGWMDSGVVTIEASNERDAYAGLGYAHGYAHAWSLVLWRHTATGRLGEWFGAPVLDIDGLARQLSFAAQARAAFETLPLDERAHLEAYARGINAALTSRPIQLRDEFALLHLAPEPWKPWHTLALEHLFAWLGTTPPTDAPDPTLASFLLADRRLRDWLHLYGFENSMAMAVRDSSETALLTRHVYGTSALPFVQETALTLADGSRRQGVTMPGMPFFLTGARPALAWTVFWTSDLDIAWAPFDTTAALTYERLLEPDSSESLVAIRRTAGTLWLDARRDTLAATLPDSMTVLPDSAWAIRWPGLQPVSDAAAWQAVASGASPDFQLIRGDGLVLDAEGTWRVLGEPPSVQRLVRGILIGNTTWTPYLAERLIELAPSRPEPRTFLDDTYSPWAAAVAPPLIASVDRLPSETPLLPNALDYLRNWDFRYNRASIGASIFDLWMLAYHDSLGVWPYEVTTDTLGIEPARRRRALETAVQRLEAELGSDLSQWRWERIYPDVRSFPVWSAAEALPALPGRLARTRYAPIRLPERGHPSTLAWGPSPLHTRSLPTAAWEGWVSTASWPTMYARRRRFEPERFLGRHLASTRTPPPVPLRSPAPPDRITRLRPARR